MANYKSAIRRIRSSERSRKRNRQDRSMLKTAIKSVTSSSDKEAALQNFNKTQSLLDKLAAKGIIHRNKAANQKARLAVFVNNL